jgi:3'-phosphoadenosine 5'-phosphosulfate sulfotransferase (PAPS reductase)/FAD synthetase
VGARKDGAGVERVERGVVSPFRIEGPAVVSFSGGRSSGMLLARVVEAHGGQLPSDVHAVFTNTGVEREETLRFVDECACRWGVEIVWLERAGKGFRVVDFESASREGEPFAELIGERKFIPNAVARFCTQELKIAPMRAWMAARHEHWTNVVGLRRDEAPRVLRLRARDHGQWDVACPLYDAGVHKADVAAFWSAQGFDLALAPYESNCTLCFLKPRAVRERIARAHPELAGWWIAQEARVGGRFHAHERGYADLVDRVQRLPLLPMDLDPEEPAGLPCACTDRRRPRCGCSRTGRGHTLACAFARAA